MTVSMNWDLAEVMALEDSQVANTAVKLGKDIISKYDLTNLTGCDDFHFWRQSNCRAKPPFLDSQGREGACTRGKNLLSGDSQGSAPVLLLHHFG